MTSRIFAAIASALLLAGCGSSNDLENGATLGIGGRTAMTNAAVGVEQQGTGCVEHWTAYADGSPNGQFFAVRASIRAEFASQPEASVAIAGLEGCVRAIMDVRSAATTLLGTQNVTFWVEDSNGNRVQSPV